MSPAPDDTAHAMGLHEAARRAVGLLRDAARLSVLDAHSYSSGTTAFLCVGCGQRSAQRGTLRHSDGCLAERSLAAADALEAALQPAAGDEERAREVARRLRAWHNYREVDALTLTEEERVEILETGLAGLKWPAQEQWFAQTVKMAEQVAATFALIRAEAAAERARLTQPDAERVERLIERTRPEWHALVACSAHGTVAQFRQAQGALLRAILSALAAEAPCPACGARSEADCRGLEVGP